LVGVAACTVRKPPVWKSALLELYITMSLALLAMTKTSVLAAVIAHSFVPSMFLDLMVSPLAVWARWTSVPCVLRRVLTASPKAWNRLVSRPAPLTRSYMATGTNWWRKAEKGLPVSIRATPEPGPGQRSTEKRSWVGYMSSTSWMIYLRSMACQRNQNSQFRPLFTMRFCVAMAGLSG